jgi:hypothetical protein
MAYGFWKHFIWMDEFFLELGFESWNHRVWRVLVNCKQARHSPTNIVMSIDFSFNIHPFWQIYSTTGWERCLLNPILGSLDILQPSLCMLYLKNPTDKDGCPISHCSWCSDTDTPCSFVWKGWFGVIIIFPCLHCHVACLIPFPDTPKNHILGTSNYTQWNPHSIPIWLFNTMKWEQSLRTRLILLWVMSQLT